MGNSLTTGVTGLIAHRRMLDVVGNNLANVNSIGYKSQRALFTDLFYETVRAGSVSSNQFIGGVNPSQIGSGVKLSQVDRNFSQGGLELTGGEFDFAIQGNGFFVVSNGDASFFTRSGAFAVDANQRLVDPATGFSIQRIGSVGEPTISAPGYQDPADSGIQIPFGVTIPGEQTSLISMAGNLTAAASPPVAAVFTMISPLAASSTPATASTLLNDLDSTGTGFVTNDVINISGTAFNGDPVAETLDVDGTTTVGDLLAAIDNAFPEASAELTAAGLIQLTADDVGETPLSLTLANGAGNTGQFDFDAHRLNATTVGTSGDELNSAIEFVDSLGRSHTMHFTFHRIEGDHLWEVRGSVNPESGSLSQDLIATIAFNDDGSFQRIAETGSGSTSISVGLDGITQPQIVNLSFGDPDSFSGISQSLTQSSISLDADGFEAGTLSSIAVSADGVINGIASNGRIVPIAQMAIATFANDKGLEAVGDGYYLPSLNSGQPQISTAQSGGRGLVTSGNLESSNVDIAFEFTRLIVAQRGFSANARTITVSDEVLEELTGIIR